MDTKFGSIKCSNCRDVPQRSLDTCNELMDRMKKFHLLSSEERHERVLESVGMVLSLQANLKTLFQYWKKPCSSCKFELELRDYRKWNAIAKHLDEIKFDQASDQPKGDDPD